MLWFFIALGAGGGLLAWRAERKRMAAGPKELREASREQRRKVARVVRRGEAVFDPRDATLAVAVARDMLDRIERVRSGRKRLARGLAYVHVMFFIAVFLIAAIVGGFQLSDFVLLLPPAYFVLARLTTRHREARVRQALEKNRQLTGFGTAATPMPPQ